VIIYSVDIVKKRDGEKYNRSNARAGEGAKRQCEVDLVGAQTPYATPLTAENLLASPRSNGFDYRAPLPDGRTAGTTATLTTSLPTG
jgi:hypothetical protein